MHELYQLKDKLIDEMKKYSGKDMSASTLDVVDKLAHATKNLCKIIDDESEYSERGGSYMMGSTPHRVGSYDGGMYDGGSYARGRGRNARRDSMGRYASGSGLAHELREMMMEAPESTRPDFEKLISRMENM